MRIRAAAAIVATAALASCGGDDDGDAKQAGDLPQGSETVELDPASFTADVDNRYWPMRPGTRWTYREVDEEGAELEVVVTATSATQRIANGVTARVVRDTVTENGELLEDTFDWYAQDDEGSVWYLGEETVEFEHGRPATREGSFEAGVDGALPGIIMPADPTDGMRYRQEYYAGEAEDAAEVLAVGEQVEVPAGHFDDVLVTKDLNPLEPRVLEFKMYAPAVGPVLALGISGGGAREELLKVEDAGGRAAAAAAAAPLGRPYR
jgi:hypothetical protein